jgi:hypothetical protein
MKELETLSSNARSNRRSFVFLGSGAAVGLVLAGYALFTARGTSTLTVPAEDVALVNQQPISRSDYVQQLQTLFGVDLQHATADQRRKVLDDMIREELFVQRGKELDVASTDPDVRGAMVGAVELEIAADAISAQPSEQQLKDYFAAHRDHYASEGVMTVRDLIFDPADPATAARAAAALASTAPTPLLLAQWHARPSTAVGDEEFYFAAKIHLGDQLFDVAKDLPDATPSVPIARTDGIHLLYMVSNHRPIPFDFAAARDRVMNDYRNDSISHLRAGDEAFLRKRANVLIADDLR